MTISGPTYDVEGLALAWARAVPGLVGTSAPLIGIHLTEDARSPSRGAICDLALAGNPTVDPEGLGHEGRIAFRVRAVGGEGGAKRQAFRGAQPLAEALRALAGAPVLLTIDGVTAKLSHAHTVYGPTWMGVQNGQSTYTVAATFVFQLP